MSKFTKLLIALLIIFFSCSKDVQIVSYPSISTLKNSNLYKVRVNGTPVWTEKLRTNFDLETLPGWFTEEPYTNEQQEVHITNFSCKGKLNVEITLQVPVDSVSIHPLSRNIKPGIRKNAFSFKLKKPEKLYIIVNKLPPLCFFANPIEVEKPDPGNENVVYFAPGVHRPGMMHPKSGTTIYIAGGAVVFGGIETDGESDIRVIGRGILDGGFQYRRMVKLQNSKNIEFDGILIRNGRSWTNTIINCDSVLYRNIKVISFRPGGDGINPLNSRHVEIDNCFLRCTDDCIAIKAPDGEIAMHDIRVTNNTMVGFAFSDGCTIGFETNAPSISDVLVKNCDIIQSRGGSRVDGHSAFSIICDGPAKIHNVRYENLRIEEDVLKLFELHITDGTKYGIDPPGHIQNVHLKNIAWSSKRPIVLKGFDTDHLVQNVVFENCTIPERSLHEMRDDVFRINEFVEGVNFK